MSFLDTFSAALPHGIGLEDLKILVPSQWWQDKPEQAAVSALCRCGKFDTQDYLKRYPDVAQKGLDSVLHFVQHGIAEKRHFKCLPDVNFGESRVRIAHQHFQKGEYEKALQVYEELSEQMGSKNFAANMALCKKKLGNKNSLKSLVKDLDKKGDNVIKICFILDNDFSIPTTVAIQSLKKNKKHQSQYKIYLICVNLSEHNIQKIKSMQTDNFVIQIINSIIKYKNIFDSNKKYLSATKSALIKFDIANIIKEDKIIYLDGDIIVKKDVSDLYNIDLEDNFAAVVPDLPQIIYNKPLFDYGNGRNYFNTGVMLLNLKKMRNENIEQKLINKKLSMTNDLLMDQNIFNCIFKKNVKIISPVYNLTYINLKRSVDKYKFQDINTLFQTNYNDLDELLDKSSIIHFSSKDKPWIFYDLPQADKWIYYFSNTPYGNINLKRKSKKEIQKIEIANNRYNKIIMATNDDYIKYLSVAIQSIKQYCKISNYSISILYQSVSKENIDRIKTMENENCKIEFIKIEPSLIDKRLYIRGHYSQEMYLRWFIPEIFFHYDKVLYLDCDLVICKDIKEIFNIDIKKFAIGACINNQDLAKAQWRYEKLGLRPDQYINSGVLLINTKKFVSLNLKHRLCEYIYNNKNLACPDQDALSVIAKNYIKIIDYRWNVQWHHNFTQSKSKPAYDEIEYKKSLKNPFILHYTSNIKPWINKKYFQSEVFWNFAAHTPFYIELKKELKSRNNTGY